MPAIAVIIFLLLIGGVILAGWAGYQYGREDGRKAQQPELDARDNLIIKLQKDLDYERLPDHD